MDAIRRRKQVIEGGHTVKIDLLLAEAMLLTVHDDWKCVAGGGWGVVGRWFSVRPKILSKSLG